MINRLPYLIRKVLAAWRIKLKYLHYMNSALLIASAVVYVAFLMMTVRYNQTDFNTLLQNSFASAIMLVLVSLNFIIGATLLYSGQYLLDHPYKMKIILLLQLVQQAVALNPILFIIGGLELIQLTIVPIKKQRLSLIFKIGLSLITIIYLLFGLLNFGFVV